MAIAYRDVATKAQSLYAQSTTINLPATFQVGDYMMLYATEGVGSASRVNPTGWNIIDVNNTVFNAHVWYSRFMQSGDTSVTVSTNATDTQKRALILVAYSGVDQTNPIIQSSHGVSGAATTTVASPALDTGTVTNAMIVSVYRADQGTSTGWTGTAGNNVRGNLASDISTSGSQAMLQDAIQAASGAVAAKTATFSVSDALSAGAIALRPAGVAAIEFVGMVLI